MVPTLLLSYPYTRKVIGTPRTTIGIASNGIPGIVDPRLVGGFFSTRVGWTALIRTGASEALALEKASSMGEKSGE